MARTKRSWRSYGAGEWGRNRVRIFPDPKTGNFQIEWRESGRRLSRSLGHRDWARAKRQADEVAAGLAVHEPTGKPEPGPLTLERLFGIYSEEVTPTKGRVLPEVRPGCIGDVPPVLREGPEARNAFAARLGPVHPGETGRVGPSGEPVSDRTVERDLRFLLAVLNWAARSRNEAGGLLLDSNPLKGLRGCLRRRTQSG